MKRKMRVLALVAVVLCTIYINCTYAQEQVSLLLTLFSDYQEHYASEKLVTFDVQVSEDENDTVELKINAHEPTEYLLSSWFTQKMVDRASVTRSSDGFKTRICSEIDWIVKMSQALLDYTPYTPFDMVRAAEISEDGNMTLFCLEGGYVVEGTEKNGFTVEIMPVGFLANDGALLDDTMYLCVRFIESFDAFADAYPNLAVQVNEKLWVITDQSMVCKYINMLLQQSSWMADEVNNRNTLENWVKVYMENAEG